LESASAAKTTRFFDHWWGRSDSRTARSVLRAAALLGSD
jgi:hypothetical protein